MPPKKRFIQVKASVKSADGEGWRCSSKIPDVSSGDFLSIEESIISFEEELNKFLFEKYGFNSELILSERSNKCKDGEIDAVNETVTMTVEKPNLMVSLTYVLEEHKNRSLGEFTVEKTAVGGV